MEGLSMTVIAGDCKCKVFALVSKYFLIIYYDTITERHLLHEKWMVRPISDCVGGIYGTNIVTKLLFHHCQEKCSASSEAVTAA